MEDTKLLPVKSKWDCLFSWSLITYLLIASFGGLLVIFYSHSFFPDFSFYLSSERLSFVVVSLFYVLLFLAKRAGDWNLCYTRKVESIFKISAKNIGLFLFMWVLTHASFIYAYPGIYTGLFGRETVISMNIIKNKGGRRSCNYQVRPKKQNSIFLHFCITREMFNSLPDDDLQVDLRAKESRLGYLVKEVLIK